MLIITTSLVAACGGSSSPAPIPPPSYSDAKTFIEAVGFVGSILVKRGNNDVVRDGFGFANSQSSIPNTPDTRFRIGSLTKAFTALSILQLSNDGLITDLDVSLKSILPITSPLNALPNVELIKISDLLTHRSGIPDYLGLVDNSRNYELDELLQTLIEDLLRAQLLGESLPTPDSLFEYSNSNYLILTEVIELLSGQDYFTYLNNNILSILSLTNTEIGASDISGIGYALGYASRDTLASPFDMSIASGAGALSSNLADLEVWGDALLTGDIVSDADREKIFAEGEYGLGWIVDEIEGKQVYYHFGGIAGFSSVIALFPDTDGIFIALSNIENQADQLTTLLTTFAREEF